MRDKGTGRLYLATALGLAVSTPVLAQENNNAVTAADIVVTARRVEERLQDVPISITVMDQQDLADRNITNTGDIATYTPSLSSNERFGLDSTTFAIRGFTQELRTTASVGVYFADVVAPRGNGSTPAGDGAGPGYVFDLQNIQVLKGPQGTLFGRNTTGGAVLLVPQRPTDEWEGYVEGSVGTLNMWRAQGVLNVPISENARARFGFDTQRRDGTLHNENPNGVQTLGNVDYIAGRASLVVDLTPALENYTIVTYAQSDTNGTVASMFACNPGVGLNLLGLCDAQLAGQRNGFYDFSSSQPDAQSFIEQWQIINTTTWDVNDDLRIRNIFSYADLNTILRSPIFGSDFELNGRRFWFTESDQMPGVPTTSQTSMVEELQLLGYAFDGRLNWQAGAYYEESLPDGVSGSQLERLSICAENPGIDPDDFLCTQNLTSGVTRNRGEIEFENRAIYAQGTYALTDALNLTAGARYTWDESAGWSSQITYSGFPGGGVFGPPTTEVCVDPSTQVLPDCRSEDTQRSEAPTWTLGLDYRLTEDAMLYGKYSRGYRQGAVNPFGAPGFRVHGPEEVDTYEVGAKTQFEGPISGVINVSGFYNELRNQQIQTGFSGTFGNTTGILNAGESRLWGVELESNLQLTEQLSLDLSYAYLNTELLSIETVPPPPGVVVVPSAVAGDPLPLTPENKLVATATYVLPMPQENGQFSIGVTYVYTDEQLAATASEFGVLPAYELVNLNLNWHNVLSSNLDASLFVTNLFDEEHTTYVMGLWTNLGAEFRQVGLPTMAGVRLRYSFE
jgi:iron complex outermembrane receptor protein